MKPRGLLFGLLISIVCSFCTRINAQDIVRPIDTLPDTTLVLTPDNTDSYILSYYLYGRYRIEIGYNAYFKKLHESEIYDKGLYLIVKHYVDSLKMHEKLVQLLTQNKIRFKDSIGHDFKIDDYADEIITELFETGNIKVFDFRKKHYLSKVYRKKIDSSRGEFYQFSDVNTGKVFFTYTLSSPVF